MATMTFTNGNHSGNLSDPLNWNPGFPSNGDTAVIDSARLLPPGQALSVHGSLSTAGIDLLNLIELTGVDLSVSQEFSVSGLAHLMSGEITVNNGSNPGNFDIGANGSGEFIQDGGTSVAVNAGLLLGYPSDTSNGSYHLLGAATLSARFETIGGTGSGVFEQNGGTNTIAGALVLAQGGGPAVNSGVYQLTGGSLHAGIETVGDASNGQIAQSNASTNTVDQTLTLGNQQASSGDYEVTDSTLNVGNNIVVGFSGQGTFDQGGGQTHVNGGVVLAVNEGAGANYHLHDGGTLSANFLTVARGGEGELDITNGAIAQIATDVKLGVQVNSDNLKANGSLEVAGTGSALTIGGALDGGIDGSGHLAVQQGGVISASAVNLGVNAGSNAEADITDADSQVSVTGTGNFVIGAAGAAAVKIEKGASVTADRVLLAAQADGQGAANITGAGTLVHATHTSSEQGSGIVVGVAGHGAMQLSDGALLQSDSNMTVGGSSGSSGALEQTGGTAIVQGTLMLAASDGSSGVYQMTGGLLQTDTAQINTNGELDVCGGLALIGNLVMNGGVFEICGSGGGAGGKVEITHGATGGAIGFGTGPGTLQIDDAPNFHTTLSGAHAGDTIDLAHQQVIAESYDGSVLNLTFSDNHSASLLIPGVAENGFHIVSDGNGGSDVVFDTTAQTAHWTRSVDIAPHPAGWSPAGIGDFNHDATSDLAWFNPTNGDLDIWELANGQWSASSDVGPHPAGYQPVGFGDYNHDGTSDVLWFNPTTHDVDLWEMSNGKWAGSVGVGPHPAGYTPSGTGDFNGDGTSDVLWYNPTTRDVDIWEMSNGHWAASSGVGSHPARYQLSVIGDFNRDGTSDIAWFNPTTGDLDIWKMADGKWAGSVDVGSHPAGYQPLAAADFNKDGTSDIIWYNPTTNDVDVWLLNNNGQWSASVSLGSHPAGAVPVGVGDFDHNGVTDVMWQDTHTGHIDNWMLGFG